MVGEQLHGQDGENALQAVDGVRHWQVTVGQLLDLDVVLVADDDRAALRSSQCSTRNWPSSKHSTCYDELVSSWKPTKLY